MNNLINRIKIIEKKVIPEPPKSLHNLIMYGWYKDGKPYYKDDNGEEKEFIESEHKGVLLVVFLDMAKGEQ